MIEQYWCKTAPNVPRVWSASSLACIADCPRRFELRYVEGWTSKEESLDFLFGTAFHAGMFTYFTERLKGLSKDDALDAAICTAWSVPIPNPVRVKQAGKTHIGLARCLTAYADQYDDDLESIVVLDGKPALEVPFRFVLPLLNPDGENYSVRGYIDILRKFGGIYTVFDYKTTASSLTDFYFSKFEINIQNYIYSAAMRVLTGLDVTQFMVDPVSITQYQDVELTRRPINVSPGEVDEGVTDALETIRLAEHYAQRNYWPKNTSSCAMCEFKTVCNKDPKLRISSLESDFVEKRRTVISEER